MSKQIMTIFTVAAVFAVSAVLVAAPSAKAHFEVAFGFKAADTIHPGGKYEIAFEEGNKFFSLRNVESGKTTIVPFASRTEGRGQCKGCGKPIGEAEIVFQQDEGAPYLYEVYMPNSDGFHLAGAPGKEHKHVVMQSGH